MITSSKYVVAFLWKLLLSTYFSADYTYARSQKGTSSFCNGTYLEVAFNKYVINTKINDSVS